MQMPPSPGGQAAAIESPPFVDSALSFSRPSSPARGCRFPVEAGSQIPKSRRLKVKMALSNSVQLFLSGKQKCTAKVEAGPIIDPVHDPAMAKTGKRQRDVEGGGGEGESGKTMDDSQQQQGTAADSNGRGRELPDADLGSGTRWSLGTAVLWDGEDRKRVKDKLSSPGTDKDVARIIADNARLLICCEAMLEQALSGSEHGDVRFEFEDGRSPLSGHRAVLCAVSDKYMCMFRSGMIEEQTGVVHVPPGVSESGYRGLLEFVYLGRGGEQCAKADGRELWVLGEMYGVKGMLEWLLEEGINGSNFMGAYEFALVPEGVERGGIAERCAAAVEDWRRPCLEEAGLRGTGWEAVKGLALACSRRQAEEGRFLGWRCARAGLRLLEEWTTANGGEGGSWFLEAAGELDLMGMPYWELYNIVWTMNYLDEEWISGLLERKQADYGNNMYELEYDWEQTYDLSGHGTASRMAVHEDWIATFDPGFGQIVIFNILTGDRVANVGSEGIGPGQFSRPAGIAFSSTGELYVSDVELHRIQVFDEEDTHVRRIGGPGRGQGQFCYPDGLCFTADGHLVVADRFNHRVQILREDGTFVRAFGSQGPGAGQFLGPRDVGIGPDGSIAVLDKHSVQVFDEAGVFVRSIGHEPGQFMSPTGLAVGGGGEIIVGDEGRKEVLLFGQEGKLLQIIGAGSGVDGQVYFSRILDVATCGYGQLFVSDDFEVKMLFNY